MDCLKEFLRRDCYYGSGSNSGSSYGDGSGNGDGSSSGSSYGDGDGSGSGTSPGSGDRYNPNCGSGDGYGYGHGDGDGSGSGHGYRIDFGIKSIGEQIVHYIDGVPTILQNIRGNIAKGSVLCKDLTLEPCFVVKSNRFFAHGETLKDAMSALQEKLFNGMSRDERIDAFISEFPTLETMVGNEDLFHWHHKLTGSCEMGRNQFVTEHGINLNEEMTVMEFINLTKNSYSGDIIKELLEHYMGKEFKKI